METQIEKEISEIFGWQGSLYRQFEQLPAKLVSFSLRVLVVLILFVIGSWLITIGTRSIRKSLVKSKVDNGSVTFISMTVKVLLYFVLVMVLGRYFGIDAASVVTLLGSAGLTIGLAAQGSLSNFAGGLLILISKPFKVGDFIMETKTGQEGTVFEINLFYPKLKMRDNRVVVIPNGELANSTLVNASALQERRVDLMVSIAYHTDIDKARDLILSLLAEEKILPNDRKVYVADLSNSAVDLGIEFYVSASDYLEMKRKILEQIKKAFDREGIVIPFEQLDVHVV